MEISEIGRRAAWGPDARSSRPLWACLSLFPAYQFSFVGASTRPLDLVAGTYFFNAFPSARFKAFLVCKNFREARLREASFWFCKPFLFFTGRNVCLTQPPPIEATYGKQNPKLSWWRAVIHAGLKPDLVQFSCCASAQCCPNLVHLAASLDRLVLYGANDIEDCAVLRVPIWEPLCSVGRVHSPYLLVGGRPSYDKALCSRGRPDKSRTWGPAT